MSNFFKSYMNGKLKDIKNLDMLNLKILFSNSAILITGESSKDVIARETYSPYCTDKKAFESFNCRSFLENLLKNELFDHEQYLFTKVGRRRIEILMIVKKGPVSLDEVSNTPIYRKQKVLQVIEEKSFRRVGGEINISFDFRLICAVNQNLFKQVEDGSYRLDLLYRPCVIKLYVPPVDKLPKSRIQERELTKVNFTERKLL